MANNSLKLQAEENNSPSDNFEAELPEISADESKLSNGFHKKMMTNLPKRPPALIEYADIVYTVREKTGRWFSGVVGQTKPILLSLIHI